MAVQNTRHLEKFAVAKAQISSLQSQLDHTVALRATPGEDQLEVYKEKPERAERAMIQLRLELAQSVIAASGVSSAGQLGSLQTADDKVCQLQSELAQARRVASDSECLGLGFNPVSAQAKQWANALIAKCTEFAGAQMRAMQLEHDEALQECEQRIFDAEASHERHIEQFQAQVPHFHDLATGAVSGDAGGEPRSERPAQS